MSTIDDELLSAVLAAVRPGPRGTCLDVGTGTGGPVALALARAGARVVGLDPRLGGAERPPWAARTSWCAGDALHLPVRSRSVRLLTCRHALHHIRDLDEAFAEIGRVVAGGGTVAVLDGIAPAGERLAGFLHRAYDLRDGGPHVRYVSLTRWRELMRRAGLHLVRVEARLRQHELLTWMGRVAPPPPEVVSALRAHFESAPPAVRAALRMVPATGLPHRFCTVEAAMIAKR
jgi:SAM-dependent methyltransferase